MLGILKSNNKYNDNLRKYSKKDGLFALVLFVVVIMMYSTLGLLYKNNSFVKENIKIFGIVFNIILIIITIFFVKCNKQKLDTIGFIVIVCLI